MTTLPTEDLATRLRAWARGLYPVEAAVELLVAHETWLVRADFQQRLCWFQDHAVTGEPLTSIDWAGIEDFLAGVGCSSSEAQVLRLAGELAGTTSGIALGDLLSGLDETNTWLVLRAVAHARGYRITRHIEPLDR